MSFIPTTIEELETFSKENSNTLLFISFKASWCKPCKEMKPFIDYLKEQYKNINFYDIDIEDEDVESITNYFNIKKVPTFIYYKNGSICNLLLVQIKNLLKNILMNIYNF